MIQKYILFTFDYELFLGRKSGSVQKCLIEPTKRLLSIFDHYKIYNALFFIDTAYLMRLEQIAEQNINARKDLFDITNQLKKILEKGHYIYPHLHPHWLDADYDENTNEWSLNNLSKYRFGNLTSEQQNEIFSNSMRILSAITTEIKPEYPINAYRAGGWSIQPFSVFEPYFDKFNIKYDFSVMPGKFQFTNAQYYDFRKISAGNAYRFSNSIENYDPDGRFTELPITTMTLPGHARLLDRVWLKILWKLNIRSGGDGKGVVPQSINGGTNPSGYPDKSERTSIELLDRITIFYYKKYLDRYSYIQFISHPKMLSSHNIKTFRIFLDWATKKFVIQTDFQKIIQDEKFIDRSRHKTQLY